MEGQYSFLRDHQIRYIYIFQDPIMMAEEKSSILIDVDSSEKDMKYFEEKKRCLDVFAVVSDLDQTPPIYMNSINHVKKWSGSSAL